MFDGKFTCYLKCKAILQRCTKGLSCSEKTKAAGRNEQLTMRDARVVAICCSCSLLMLFGYLV